MRGIIAASILIWALIRSVANTEETNAAILSNNNSPQHEEKPATNRPKFLSQGREFQVREGTDLELACDVEDLGEFVILWKFNRTQVLFAGNLRIYRDNRIHRDDRKGSLLIKGFQLENAGEYTCQISTNPPQDIVYTIKVIAPPQIRPEPKNGQVTVKKNDTIRLNCDLSSESAFPTRITWKKVNDKYFNAKQDQNSSELLIVNARKEDAGIYECVAVNQIGETSSTFRVHVLYKPEVEVEQKLVHAPVGHSVDITCTIHADPSATVQWFNNMNTKLLPQSDKYVFRRNESHATLTIVKVMIDDYDHYSCVANNYLGSDSKTIEVSGKPSRPQFTSAQISDKEDSYELSWILSSETTIKSYSLRIRETNLDDSEPKMHEWKHFENIRPQEQELFGTTGTKSGSFLIENLSKDKNYEIDLLVENDFGVTRSEIFSFVTSSAIDGNGVSFKKLNFWLILTLISLKLFFI